MTKGLKVFIVDDDSLFVFLTKKTIKSINNIIDFREFADGEYALAYLKQIAGDVNLLPDIIFLDLSMPVMDGWAFLKEYVQLEPTIGKRIKIYIFSSSISPHDVERAKNYNSVTDFIIKPIAKEKMMNLLAS